MTLFTESELRARARARASLSTKTSPQLLAESRDSSKTGFDVFLSHAKLDAELIDGARLALEAQGLTVYVDWQADPQLDRTNVTAGTAEHLRRRMSQCKMLIYVHSENSAESKWCPWELGYFDGLKDGNVFIMPVVGQERHVFIGQEYLGLYPYIDKSSTGRIWIEKSNTIAFIDEALRKSFRRKTV